jgi:hypothetical protein
MPTRAVPLLRPEFSGADLKDRRLEARLGKVVEAISAAPELGFPQLMASDAELEAFYRFLGNERVHWRDILQPHVEATAARCRQHPLVYVAHDTSEFAFGGSHRANDIGHLQHGHAGFYGHFGLAVAATEARPVLGVLAVSTKRRPQAIKLTKTERAAKDRATPLEKKESARWLALVDEAAAVLGGEVALIHVMDREADDYVLLFRLMQKKHRFVLRAAGDRRLEFTDEATVQELLAVQPDVMFRTVMLGARAKKQGSMKHAHPPRGMRTATLHLRATTAVLRKPSHAKGCPQLLPINIVQVFEPSPPEGEEAISWTLMTTEPIATAAERTAVVDAYRARWRIEEFFKSLKTGCAYEKRQLESEHALLNALALLTPVAWRLLALRDAAREAPQAPATHHLRHLELKVLRAISKRVKLGKDPTIEQAVLAIAGLGGHLKRNGNPGWQTLGRGYERLQFACVAWQAAQRSDQS